MRAESWYQNLKIELGDIIPISRDAFHVYIGCITFLIVLLFVRKGRIGIMTLIPVFFVAIGMEVIDLRDDIATFGYPRFDASLHDVINTSLIPILMFCVLKLRGWNSKR